jgi:parallel beta-helix repeat protein
MPQLWNQGNYGIILYLAISIDILMYRRVAVIWLSWVMVFSAIVIIVEITEPVRGATITVDDSGGANFFTISMAINAANDGDTVYVYSGTYNEHVVVDKIINLTGEDRDTTIIDGQGVGDVVHISSNWVNVSGFTIKDSGPNGNPRDAGVDIDYVHNVTISECKFTDNRDAIYIYYSNNSMVTNNIIDDFEGIDISHSTNILISGNTITTQYDGIDLDNSIMCKISDNAMIDTGFEFSGWYLENWNSHEIDISNTVNGDPVYYWKNQNGGTVPTGAGHVILANCTNVIVENQHITDTYIGIILGYSDNNLITSNNLSSTEEYGLSLYSSDNNSIVSNTFWNNDLGIRFFQSNINNISNNIFLDNKIGIEFGYSEINTISGNTILDNTYGLMIFFSDENIINENNVERTWVGYGISLWDSSNTHITKNTLIDNTLAINLTDSYDNEIFHNSFISNYQQAYDDTISGNYWDNGYPSGGNYWDDYSGADVNSGLNQDISGSDGIGDTHYEIDSDSFDNYPLMEPWGSDSSAPSIELLSPPDNSFIDIGTKINLSISDLNLDEVTYSVNDGGTFILSSPYNIDTGDWIDGDYEIEVHAKDTSDNEKTVVFQFYVDTKPPKITLDSPGNNSLINANSQIEFTISDANIDDVSYTKNGGGTTSLSQPYRIDPSGWSEGEYIINILAKDKADNINKRWYRFTLDKTLPQIILNSPENGSVLPDLSLDFDISDDNLNSVSFIKNQEAPFDFQAPYDLDATSWEDGEYRITIKADDTAQNVNEKWFIFKKDSTSPSITSISPDDDTIDILVDENIVIDFSESMDTESVESAISISPYSEYSCTWSSDNSTLTLSFSEPLEYQTLYEISIGTSAQDMASNSLESKSEFEFITVEQSDNEIKENPLNNFTLIIIIIVSIIASIVIVLLLLKRQKTNRERLGAWPSLQEQSMEIKCPQCGFYFTVNRTEGLIHVQCPNCGTQGYME